MSEQLDNLDLTPAPTPAPEPAPAPEPKAADKTPAPSPAPAPEPKAETTWRDKLAGDDKDFRKRLDRFADEASFAKSYRALEQKLSSGEYKQVVPYPETGTDEQKAEWRKANGIPDQPSLYVEKLALPEGVVPGEADQTGLTRLAEYAQNKNWSQDQYNAVVEAYYNEIDAATNEREAADDQFHQTSEDALRAQWGNDYRKNVNAIQNYLNGAPEVVREKILTGRTSEGRLIGDDPQILQWLADTALQLVDYPALLPGTEGADAMAGDEQKWNALIGDINSEYHTGTDARRRELRAQHEAFIDRQLRATNRAA